jgi:tRNA pseudouridine13 synthase
MEHDGPVLKHFPADFLVRESLVVDLSEEEAATHQYVTLRKCGYTTSEAVGMLADAFDFARRDVTYAGLKDEDAITEQLMAIPSGIGEKKNDLPWSFRDNGRWIDVRHYGYGGEPLSIGVLPGNCFRVTARNLDIAHTEWMATTRKALTFFLNYYDHQRFGVPGGPKRTHHVGAAILAGEWKVALDELRMLKAPESEAARLWDGPPEKFFQQIDPRSSSFFLASHASALWNKDLSDVVGSVCADSYQVAYDGLTYRWAGSDSDAAAIIATSSRLPYPRYKFTEDGIEKAESERTTVVQSLINISDYQEDEVHSGRARATFSMFLPSGSYATAAIRQFLGYSQRAAMKA